LPTFLIKDGHSVVSSLGYTTLMSLGGPVGSLIGLALADSVGRKASIVGSSLAAAAFGLAYPFMPDGAPLALVGFCLVSDSLSPSWNGEASMALNNATPFLLWAFGHLVLGWLWLDQGCVAASAKTTDEGRQAFLDGKLRACRFFLRVSYRKSTIG
jgi:hypothetical protein